MSAILRSLGFLFLLVLVGSYLANSADAQLARGLGRNLGIFSGSGYHKANPLVESSYYNPYSHLNSVYLGGISSSMETTPVALQPQTHLLQPATETYHSGYDRPASYFGRPVLGRRGW